MKMACATPQEKDKETVHYRARIIINISLVFSIEKTEHNH